MSRAASGAAVALVMLGASWGNAAADEKPIVFRKVVSQPRVLYPPVALRNRVEGTVDLKVTIEPSGEVSHVVVLSGPEDLREAARQSLMQRKYEAHEERTVVPVRVLFKLPPPPPPKPPEE